MAAVKLRARLVDWLSLRPALIHVYEGPVAAAGRNLQTPPGGNHFAWLLVRGSVVITQKHKITRAEEGQWLIVNPGVRKQVFAPGTEIVSVHFQAKWPDGCDLFDRGLSVVLPAAEHPRLEREARRLLRKFRGVLPRDPAQIRQTPLTVEQYLTLQHLGLGFIAALAEALEGLGVPPARIGQTDERLIAVLHQLDQWPLEQAFRETALAQANGLSTDHLVRQFRAAFGLSPTNYVGNRRRDYARRQLGHSAVPIKEIASRLGFRALADFSSWFKRAHGQSPRAFRDYHLESPDL